MNFSRRDFIKTSSTAIAAVAVGSSFNSAVFAGGAAVNKWAVSQNADLFRKHLGSKFSLAGETSAIPVELIEVKEISTRGEKTTECFSLVFQSPFKFEQKTYALSHPALGKFHLFLVPGKTSNGASALHAVFNRI